MHTALSLIGFVSAFVLIAGAVITVLALQRAPDGFEDDSGFQFLNTPGTGSGSGTSGPRDSVAGRGEIRIA